MSARSFIKQIAVPKIIQTVDMAEYHEKMREAPPIYVWVNPPQRILDDFALIQRELQAAKESAERLGKSRGWLKGHRWRKLSERMARANRQLYAWLAQIWSQHADPTTHVTAADVEMFAHQLAGEDLSLWRWITEQTYGLIVAHSNRGALEKN